MESIPYSECQAPFRGCFVAANNRAAGFVDRVSNADTSSVTLGETLTRQIQRSNGTTEANTPASSSWGAAQFPRSGFREVTVLGVAR